MNIIIGVDEAGRGPWMGPVVAAAFCYNPLDLPDQAFIQELNDSKKLSEKKRNLLYHRIIDMSRGDKPQVFFGLGMVDNYVIDTINIRQANREAMNRALIEIQNKLTLIQEKQTFKVLIDGRDNYIFDCLENQAEYIVGGDGIVPEIGGASIIAKVFRDKIMNQYATLYPDYCIEKHKGYGTKKHAEKLKHTSDITGIHRMSYKPVQKIMNT